MANFFIEFEPTRLSEWVVTFRIMIGGEVTHRYNERVRGCVKHS
jgi:hypothetical protein